VAKEPQPFKFDPNPMYACEVIYVDGLVTEDGRRRGVVKTWMAFDPLYPPSEAQIQWHRRNGTPGADRWKEGEVIPRVSRS